MQLDFWTVNAHCWPMFNFSSTRTPKSISTTLISTTFTSTQMQHLLLGLVELGPHSLSCQGPSGWNSFLHSPPKLGRFCFHKLNHTLLLNWWKYYTVLVPDLQGKPSVPGFHLDTELLTVTLWMQLFLSMFSPSLTYEEYVTEICNRTHYLWTCSVPLSCDTKYPVYKQKK